MRVDRRGPEVSEVFSLAVVPGASCRPLDEVGCFNVFLLNIYRAAFICVYAQQNGVPGCRDQSWTSYIPVRTSKRHVSS